MTRDEALEKVRKLLALSHSDNPHEAALAASRAQAIMERHAIESFELEAEAGTEAEAIEHHIFGPQLQRKSTWQAALAIVVSGAFGCAAIWHTMRDKRTGGQVFTRMVIAGRPRDVKAAIAARDYCHREIDRLTATLAGGRGRAWGVMFRMGCVHAINLAIEAERAALKQELEGKVSCSALTVYDARKAEALESFGKTSKVSGKLSGDDMAYAAGVVAGRHVYAGTKPRIEEGVQ